MKGDFSRFTFRPEKHYAGVLLQQGRVQLDADWNEQVEITAERDRRTAVDVIGPCGAPSRGGGFAVSCTEDGELAISAGRLYVGGTLCELSADTSYLRQPDLPNAPPLQPVEGRTDLVYLDVWQRHITAVEDPEIRAPALGGPDSTTRIQVVWQVRVRPDVAARECDEPIDDWPPPASGGRLAATIGAHAGYRGLENQLYRIEIHEGGAMGTATFKWSRDNGAVVFVVLELLPEGARVGSRAVVEPIGPDPRLALNEGDWVELIGDQSELGLGHGTLVRVTAVDQGERAVWLEGDLGGHAKEAHLKLRRWDQGSAAPLAGDKAIELDPGVIVRFSGGPFRSGDHWVFPARTGAETVEWPSAPPRGVQHDYCRLALVTWRRTSDGSWASEVRDCRRLFEALSARTCEGCREELAELRAALEAQAGELSELRGRLDG